MDTNHVVQLELGNPDILAKLKTMPSDAQIRACAITLGEIEAGHQMTPSTNQARRDAVRAFVNSKFGPNALPITPTTGWYFAQIMGRLWRTHPPSNRNKSSDVHLNQLGVNMNDLWIVASAWEHGLILLTNDKMDNIRKEVTEVQWESWY